MKDGKKLLNAFNGINEKWINEATSFDSQKIVEEKQKKRRTLFKILTPAISCIAIGAVVAVFAIINQNKGGIVVQLTPNDSVQIQDNTSAVQSTPGASADYDVSHSGKMFLEGILLKSQNGILLLSDHDGDILITPPDDDKDVFANLKSGDRISITCDYIQETYPASTKAKTVKKISDRKAEDIPEERVLRLASLGYVPVDLPVFVEKEETFSVEGLLLRAENNCNFLLSDHFGDIIITPPDDDKDVFANLKSGDRISITCDSILSTYPASIKAKTVSKISDGKIEDIPEYNVEVIVSFGYKPIDLPEEWNGTANKPGENSSESPTSIYSIDKSPLSGSFTTSDYREIAYSITNNLTDYNISEAERGYYKVLPICSCDKVEYYICGGPKGRSGYSMRVTDISLSRDTIVDGEDTIGINVCTITVEEIEPAPDETCAAVMTNPYCKVRFENSPGKIIVKTTKGEELVFTGKTVEADF